VALFDVSTKTKTVEGAKEFSSSLKRCEIDEQLTELPLFCFLTVFN
jgi:hypothetical protein